MTEQETVRRQKLNEVSEKVNPYPERFDITHEIKAAKSLDDEVKDVRVAGRIVFMRQMGKLTFLAIRDINEKLQISIKKDIVGEEQ